MAIGEEEKTSVKCDVNLRGGRSQMDRKKMYLLALHHSPSYLGA